MTCSIENCGKPVYARGWCKAHYMRWHSYGDPLGGGRKTMNGDPRRFYDNVVMAYEGDECLIWPFALRDDGYAALKHKRKMETVSRMVCEEEHGPPPTPKHQAAHSCGKGHLACVTKGHLSWKTPAENTDDKIAHGTVPRGSSVSWAKLKENDIVTIRARLAQGERTASIAADFGVSTGLIYQIANKEVWAHVQ